MRIARFLLATEKYMPGRGGRAENNRAPQGMTWASLKHHVALQPLFVIMGCGMIFVVSYCVRLATKTTDVNWRKKEEPWNYYEGKQFKFLNHSGVDFSKTVPIPKYKD